ncbi:MAG: YfiR family protein [Planctomycetes bacterium]|nr:YfiR family protein [Planctomycetota bacterium]MBU2457423.1 YfiR family protein [Planctomycetota bacterium]MBU2596848.1 YfiR family protein [Planctomycetota bacterium]
MKIKIYILMFLILALFAVPKAQAGSATAREYQVKAAFLYNFIMFIDWPDGKMPAANEPIIIGIIGKDPFEDAFDPVKDKQAKGRKVVVKKFKGFEELKKSDETEFNQQIEAVKKCHLLFICLSEKKNVKEITDLVKGSNILIIGDMPKFLEAGGGMINFVLEEQKIRFEVDAAAAKQAGLKIRSQLLRLATRVIGMEREAKD